MIAYKASRPSLSLFPTGGGLWWLDWDCDAGNTPAGLDWWGQSELGRAQWGGGDSHSGGGVRKKGPTMGVDVWHDPSQHGPCKVPRVHHQALDRSSGFSVFLPWVLPLFIHFASGLYCSSVMFSDVVLILMGTKPIWSVSKPWTKIIPLFIIIKAFNIQLNFGMCTIVCVFTSYKL